MAQTAEGAKKFKERMIAKFGSEEAWREYMRQVGRKGGKAKKTAPSGFAAMTPEQRADAGRRGGVNRWAKRGEE